MCVLLYQRAEQQTTSLEDLEFQKLEGEINQAEGKESQNQEVLKEMAEYQRLAVTRKVQDRNIYHTGLQKDPCAELNDSDAETHRQHFVSLHCGLWCVFCYCCLRKGLQH